MERKIRAIIVAVVKVLHLPSMTDRMRQLEADRQALLKAEAIQALSGAFLLTAISLCMKRTSCRPTRVAISTSCKLARGEVGGHANA
jgi:uncharacterized membrane protein YdcZ (DUF606 family)